MINLALAVAFGLAIGVIFKIAARLRLERFSLLTANYGAAFLLSLASVASGEIAFEPTAGFVAMAAVTGVVFITGFFVMAVATEVAGMSLAVAVIRLSVVIPFLASWIIWDEVPTQAQAAGLALGGAAFFLISRRRRAGIGADEEASARRIFLVLVVLFLAGGAIDTLMKTYGEVFSDSHDIVVFTTLVFGAAFLTGTAIIVVRGQGRPPMKSVAWGILLGCVNFASAVFFLRAVGELSGTFVFPANNIALVIGGALLGVTIWKERLSPLNWIGLTLAMGALVLLNF